MSIHIYHATGQHWRIRYRYRGAKTWTPGAYRYRSFESAAKKLGQKMATRAYKQGEVLLCAEWYEPSVQLEMRIP